MISMCQQLGKSPGVFLKCGTHLQIPYRHPEEHWVLFWRGTHSILSVRKRFDQKWFAPHLSNHSPLCFVVGDLAPAGLQISFHNVQLLAASGTHPPPHPLHSQSQTDKTSEWSAARYEQHRITVGQVCLQGSLRL